MRSTKLSIVIFLLACSFFQSAHAAGAETRISKNGIAYMTGGIGEEETLAMRPYAKKFTLNLLFSEGKAGQSLTDVNVNIYNEQSELVFRVKGAKPMLYVNLPAGTYTIVANNNGEKLRHKMTIAENTPQRVILNWKDPSDENASATNETDE